MTRPQVGERWRRTVTEVTEGIVEEVSANGKGIGIRVDYDGSARWFHAASGTWERLPDPEPEYVNGAAYHSARDGLTYLKVADGWLWLGGFVLPDKPLGPLTRLVPEVKP